MTLLQKLDRIPPCIVRLMAKTPDGRLMTNSEIQKRAGWGTSKLKRIASYTSFKNVSIGDADAFLAACGMRWSSQRRVLWVMQRAWRHGGLQTMRHLRFKTGWQASMIKRREKRIELLLSK